MPLSARGLALLIGCVGLWISFPVQAQSSTGSPSARTLPFPLNAPPGFHVELVSSRVGGARFIAVAPNGDILVAQISRGAVVAVHPDAPPGAQPTLVADGLALPNAVAFRGNDLYIAVWSGVVVIRDYPRGTGSPRVLFSDMPRSGDHNARALALDPEGDIFISSGSSCNVCREEDARLATILHYGRTETAAGSMHPDSATRAALPSDSRGRLWAVVNQRDNLAPDHTDLPPGGAEPDQGRRELRMADNVPDRQTSACRIPSSPVPRLKGYSPRPSISRHIRRLCRRYSTTPRNSRIDSAARCSWRFTAHGTGIRPPADKLVAVTYQDGIPTRVEDFVTGWLTPDRRVHGRPVGVAVAADGSLYVSDDTGYLFRVRYGS